MSAPSFDPARESESASLNRPVFVSRSQLEQRVDTPLLASDGSALPTLRTNYVQWILALALALQIFAWWRVDGYQLADSVEFMERARAVVRGEQMIDAGAVRPIGFSFLLIPFFALGEWFGLRDERALVWCVVLVQMALGLVLAWRCMRIGARLAAKTGAIAAGFLVATNPVFLQYSTQPVSDLAAGICFAYALEPLLERCSFRRALGAGLWLGVGFLIAYKTLLVTLLLIAILFLRDRFKHSATWRGLLPGIVIAMFVQSVIDWWTYGTFGISVFNYLAANVLGVLTSAMMRVAIYTHNEWLYDHGTKLYKLKEAALKLDWDSVNARELRAKQSPLFYVLEMPTFLVWPVIGAAAVSIVRMLVQRSAKAFMLLALIAAALLVMSNKGSKDLRLLLPLLPVIAPLCAYGFDWIARGIMGRFGAWRGFATIGAAVVVIVMSIATLQAINVKHFGGYWAASDWIDERARSTFAKRRVKTAWLGRDHEPEPLRVAYAYHWAVFLRQSPLVQVVKLPWQLNLWQKYTEAREGAGIREKSEDFAALVELDLFVVHLPILSGNPDLMSFVNRHFEVIAALYDQRTYEDIGPIFVLQRRTGSAHAHTFFDVTRGVSETDFTRARQIEPVLDFVDIENGDRVRLLGVEYATLPPQEFGWITYHWRVPKPVQRNWMILDRLTSPYEAQTWENNHEPAYWTKRTSTLTPDEIVSESYLVVPSHQAYNPKVPVRPIGNAYRRGDLIPTRIWMKLVELDPATVGLAGPPTIRFEMMPARIGAAARVRTPAEVGLQEMPDGIQFAADDFVRVAGFFIPVRGPWRLPDDGRPVQD